MPRASAVYNRRMAESPDAARYHRLQLWLAVTRLAVVAAFLFAMLASGAARALADAAARATAWPSGQVAIVAVVLGLAQALLGLPLAWLTGWELPRRFGLLHQSFRGWLGDCAKAAALGAGDKVRARAPARQSEDASLALGLGHSRVTGC